MCVFLVRGNIISKYKQLLSLMDIDAFTLEAPILRSNLFSHSMKTPKMSNMNHPNINSMDNIHGIVATYANNCYWWTDIRIMY
jgi:hypothetical protein